MPSLDPKELFLYVPVLIGLASLLLVLLEHFMIRGKGDTDPPSLVIGQPVGIGKNILILTEGGELQLRKTDGYKFLLIAFDVLLWLLAAFVVTLVATSPGFQLPSDTQSLLIGGLALATGAGFLLYQEWRTWQELRCRSLTTHHAVVSLDGKRSLPRQGLVVSVRKKVGHRGVGMSYTVGFRSDRKFYSLSFGNSGATADALAGVLSTYLGVPVQQEA